MWLYERATGRISKDNVSYQAYSGHGAGLNNPEMSNVIGVGPIHEGIFDMTELIDSSHTGPNTIVLVARVPLYDRSAFRIHGDNEQHDFTASDGCIILSPAALRISIWNSGDKELQVV